MCTAVQAIIIRAHQSRGFWLYTALKLRMAAMAAAGAKRVSVEALNELLAAARKEIVHLRQDAANASASASASAAIAAGSFATSGTADAATTRRAASSTSASPRPLLFDIGANLSDGMFKGVYRGTSRHESDFDAVLERAWGANVGRIIITGTSLEESRTALQMARADPKGRLYCTVGVHPTNANDFETDEGGPDAHLAALEEIIVDGTRDGRVVAVGECGLDYDREEFCDRTTQKKYFVKQLELAVRLGLPLFLHNRNTNGDFAEVMSRFTHQASFTSGVAHSFTGSQEEAKALLDLGLFIGINGCSLKTQENIDVMMTVPSDRLLIETDAPWCDIRATHAGHKYILEDNKWPAKREKKFQAGFCVKGRNEPCMLQQVFDVVAGARGLGEAGTPAGDAQREVFASLLEANTFSCFWPKACGKGGANLVNASLAKLMAQLEV